MGQASLIWKDVEGYEGLYQVSTTGLVKSLSSNKGNQYSNKVFLKKQFLNRYGYLMVTFRKNGVRKNFTVHKLVAKAFLSNPENKPQVNHINGNKICNRVENLEWCTSSENQKHRFNTLNHTVYNRLLNKNEVFEILSQKGKGWRKEISKKLGVSEACIKAVRSGRNYSDWYKEFMGLSVDDMVEGGWIKLIEI